MKNCTEKEIIKSWQALTDHIGIHREGVQRWLKLYAFPKPALVRKSRGHCVFWYKDEVNSWLKNNQELTNEHFKRCEKRR